MQKALAEVRDGLIELLKDGDAGSEEERIYREMMVNIGILRSENLDIGELLLLHKAFRELRHAMRVFKEYRDVPKAAVFGSARTPRNHPDYLIARRFGRRMAAAGWMIITGGASGIMEAAMAGAGAKNSFGLNIMLPFEQDANPIIKGNPKLMFFKYFFTRKLMFLKESAATVLFPGGFGTFDEGFESFTLVQTGKAKPRPLVLVDPKGSDFWKSTLDLLQKNLADRGLISPPDLGLMRHFQDAGAAVKEITGFYKNYHSSRFFRDVFLVRVHKRVTPAQLKMLSRDFGSMLSKGGFERMEDISGDDEKDPKLDRITCRFDRTSFSRLRNLIDVLNSF